MDKSVERLALKSDSMFQRSLMRTISREQEVKVFTAGSVYRGFVIGLDEEWLQLTVRQETDWRPVLIQLRLIEAIEQTGSTIHSLVAEARKTVSQLSKGIKEQSNRRLGR